MKISTRAVAALMAEAQAGQGKHEQHLFDDEIPGFRVRRVGKGVSFQFAYRIGRKQRSMVLGKTSAMTLTEARRTAALLHAKVKLGEDPAAEKQRARAPAQTATLFKTALAHYLARQKERLRPSSYREIERYLLKYSKPLASKPLAEIDRPALNALRVSVKEASGPRAANYWRSTMGAFFAWAMREGFCAANPILGTNKEHEPGSRERVLADAELRDIWSALKDGDDYDDIVKLLILTGTRREEIGALAWSEVDLDRKIISLPAARTKNKKPFDIPLSEPALTILQRRKAAGAARPYVFGFSAGGFKGWSACKKRLDDRLAAARDEPLPPWRLHDFRRTLSTIMHERLGVLPHVVEACINRISGHQGGVAGIYNRASYSAEKRRAFDLWAAHVTNLVEGWESNVVALRGHAI